jgi:hypothetical protein
MAEGGGIMEFTTARAHRARALGLLVVIGCGVAWADEAPVQAAWTPREFRFTYQGFTAKYSCDGLSGRIKEVLLLLGARKQDLKVSSTGCSGGFGRPTPFPGVMVKMSVLAPVDAKSAPGSEPLGTQWRNVDVGRPQALAAAGDCELTEQIKETILPLFTTRNVEYRSTCVPHQLTPGGTTLKADVLVPLPPAPAPAASG